MSTVQANIQPLEPTREQSKAIIEIIDKLSLMHYQEHRLDDAMSASLLKHYLEDLDPSRGYFNQSDIDEFSQWANSFDDMLKQGNLDAAFIIYNRYLARADTRWKQNIALLESDFEFDFDREEKITIDNESRDWPATNAEADDYWRKIVKDALLRLLLNDKDAAEAREVLIKRYKNLLNQLEQRDNEDAFARFVNSFTSLYDPHTNYMSPRVAENFAIAISLSLEGIGAVLQNEDDHTKIVSIVPKGPADKSDSLHPGDKITGVAQDNEPLVDVVGWRLDEVVKLIRGKKGTTVRLEIIPAKGDISSSRIISIVRDKIQLEEQSAQAKILQIDTDKEQPKRFGVIELPTFYLDMDGCRYSYPNCKNTTRDVKRLLDELTAEDVDGIILDLRYNGGGPLHEATQLTDLFVDSGPVVQIRSAGQRISRHQRSRRDAYYQGPLVVLINRLSASASEIFAGAIQDYGRGLVVGSQSFGKGTVQSTMRIQGGLIKLTESKFYRVSGASTQNQGIIPDVQLPSLYDHNEIGESSEPLALKWDTINAVAHRKYQNISRKVKSLQKNHDKRLETDPDLLYITQEADLFQRKRNQKQLSLNYQQRLDSKDSFEAELLELENSRRIAKGLRAYNDYKDWQEQIEEQESTDTKAKAEKEESDIITSESDPLLYEAGRIFSDYLNVSDPSNSQLVSH